MTSHPVLSIVAPAGTYTAAAASVAAWGLHISDVAVILSSLAAIGGVMFQGLIYLEQRRAGRRLKTQETKREAD